MTKTYCGGNGAKSLEKQINCRRKCPYQRDSKHNDKQQQVEQRIRILSYYTTDGPPFDFNQL